MLTPLYMSYASLQSIGPPSSDFMSTGMGIVFRGVIPYGYILRAIKFRPGGQHQVLIKLLIWGTSGGTCT